MNLDSDGMDDIISQESPLDLEGNYKKVRGGALLFINNWTIFLSGRKVAKFHPHTVKKNLMHRMNHSKL